jgi:ACR3 family arsenite transporter
VRSPVQRRNSRRADCAVLVAVNSLLQIVLYAPLGLLFINVFRGPSSTTTVEISYAVVARSVAVFLGIPLAAAIATRVLFLGVLRQERFFTTRFLPFIGPLSLIGLLFTTLIIFAAQGAQVVRSITTVLRVAAPLIVYFLVTFFAALAVCRKLGFSYRITAAQSFTAAVRPGRFYQAPSDTLASLTTLSWRCAAP